MSANDRTLSVNERLTDSFGGDKAGKVAGAPSAAAHDDDVPPDPALRAGAAAFRRRQAIRR